jgi:hypothetical protein
VISGQAGQHFAKGLAAESAARAGECCYSERRIGIVSRRKAPPDSAFQLSVTTVEEQGILESFFKLPQTEREIIRQLLEKCCPQQVSVIRLPVPFGPREFNERLNFLVPVYKLIRYHRLTFDSIADGALRWTYLPWIESITQIKSGEEEELGLRLNSNYEKVWRILRQRLNEPGAPRDPTFILFGAAGERT